MMLRIMLGALILLMAWGVVGAADTQNKGAEQINLDGGSRGVVPFPHHRHQSKLGDCDVCHTLFPQEKGGIEQLKAAGKLIKKQVMNKHCIQCHRTEKNSGNASGPTACAKCHVRKR